MPTVSIIYFTGAGHTAKLAETVDKGATSVTVLTHFAPLSSETEEQTDNPLTRERR
jgi:hypothetical protein